MSDKAAKWLFFIHLYLSWIRWRYSMSKSLLIGVPFIKVLTSSFDFWSKLLPFGYGTYCFLVLTLNLELSGNLGSSLMTPSSRAIFKILRISVRYFFCEFILKPLSTNKFTKFEIVKKLTSDTSNSAKYGSKSFSILYLSLLSWLSE